MNAELHDRVRRAHRRLVDALLAERGPEGHWTGELSSSALSTATAVTALAAVNRAAHAERIRGGLDWLAAHANSDGGWGDTIRSASNPSTTALVWAAFGAAVADVRYPQAIAGAVGYLQRNLGALDRIVPAFEALYGSDRTFSVPITMTLALAGRLGPEGWSQIRRLPFELAALPRGFFGALRLPVVSYALPALIAIGQVVHHHRGGFHPLRALTRERTLDVLTTLQPPNGGFLEATPLTSFVTMSLAGMGRADHPVTRRGAAFLVASVRGDGSWPIDTNLATWVSTLAVQALQGSPAALTSRDRGRLRAWLLGQQGRVEHPYTGAAPGGWAWTNLPGGVPDADDTSGALLALRSLGDVDDATRAAATAGVRWLLDLQNRDGGVPTFCRGWGALPFDRSTADITAHALRAWRGWQPELPSDLAGRVERAVQRALRYLARRRRADGSWLPLWFGNEHAPEHGSPVYGTAKVLMALNELAAQGGPDCRELREGAAAFLCRAQGDDGWGGDAGVAASVEETALAVEALAGVPSAGPALERGVRSLLARLDRSPVPAAAPIGLYFARLWYFERLYPLLFATGALGRAGGAARRPGDASR